MKAHTPVSRVVDLATGRLSPDEALKVLDEVEKDRAASEMLDCAIDLHTAVQTRGDWLFADDVPAAPSRLRARHRVWLPYWRSAAIALAGSAVLLALLFIYYPVADTAALEVRIGDEEMQLLVRGSGHEEIDLASHELATGQYTEAVQTLEWYIRAFPSKADVPQAHYLAGIGWMKLSQKSILGLYHTIDRGTLQKALPHFLAVVCQEDQPRLAYEARWNVARAYLMMGDSADALTYLDQVASAGGAHGGEARRVAEGIRRR